MQPSCLESANATVATTPSTTDYTWNADSAPQDVFLAPVKQHVLPV